ncbi:hypothetical protein EVG20_g7648 [Dentipellis fragilis]|uniref:Uncharacterized protein n=1 Tax=Dentipellis fragilis TaxID=205917 RepID=A0A4Y9YBV8_9AGAM|nr:hypothetical protein EVG20_g7648 [Dentipellis fragilis]
MHANELIGRVDTSRFQCPEMAKRSARAVEARETLLRNLEERYPGESHRQIRDREAHLYQDWFIQHRDTLQKAALSFLMRDAPRDPRASRNLDDYLVILYIRPRSTLSDNPALNFALMDGQVLYMKGDNFERAKSQGMGAALQAPVPLWTFRAIERGLSGRLINAVSFMCNYHQFWLWEAAPIFEPDPKTLALFPPRRMKQVDPRRQFAAFQAMILRGHALGPNGVRADIDADFKVGELVKVGEEWEWKQLSDEESRRAGYPEFPGFVPIIFSNYIMFIPPTGLKLQWI